ncbi:methyltransferase domain-containing protein [Candidatus Woesearchaeota archaeon]|nr:methyltransferase domain-containing protein [Candidatus Woesearchaeota archaeon]
MTEYDEILENYLQRRRDPHQLSYNRDIEVPAMIKMIGPVTGKTLLDLGCGFGDHAARLIKKGAKHIIGVDISKKMIQLATNRKIPRTDFSVRDLDKPFPWSMESFDIAYSSLVVHYLDNLDRLFNQVYNVLKRNGIFVYSTAHPIQNMLSMKPYLISVKKKGSSYDIKGDYFDESKRDFDMGTSVGHVKMHAYTFETLMQAALKNNFRIIDYVDALPVPSAKKRSPEKYRLTTTLPTFILFKLQKH